MELTVKRQWPEVDRLRGELLIGGQHQAFTLEPPIKPDDTKPRAIPNGTYKLTNRFSPKHGHDVPHVEDVPGFEEIEIHPGNYPGDTEGCLLVGTAFEPDNTGRMMVVQSRPAFSALMQTLVPVWQRGEGVTIVYEGPAGMAVEGS